MANSAYFVQSTPHRAFSVDNSLLSFCRYVIYILKMYMKKFDDELIFYLFLVHFNLDNHIESWPIVHTLCNHLLLEHSVD